jgi:hypothetical protein
MALSSSAGQDVLFGRPKVHTPRKTAQGGLYSGKLMADDA